MNDFERIHEFTARFEGGYVHDPRDAGGETNLGVTKAVWVAWCKSKGIPQKPMRQLTTADVLPIYRQNYWSKVEHLPWPLSAVAYDICVNSGPGNLQYMLQQVPMGTPLERAVQLCRVREQFYRAIVARKPNQAAFLKGWLRRTNELEAWVKQNAAPSKRRVFLHNGKGYELWGGKAGDIYGGLPLGEALFAQLDTVYPNPIKTTYNGVKFERAADGALLFNKF